MEKYYEVKPSSDLNNSPVNIHRPIYEPSTSSDLTQFTQDPYRHTISGGINNLPRNETKSRFD